MTFDQAKNTSTARVSGEFYIKTIRLKRRGSAVGKYVDRPVADPFGIKYRLLERAT